MAEEVGSFSEEKTHKEISQEDRYPGGKPGSESPEEGLSERYLGEIDPRPSCT